MLYQYECINRIKLDVYTIWTDYYCDACEFQMQQGVWEAFTVPNEDYKYSLLRMSFSYECALSFLSKVAGNSGLCA
jgi:hypothetical protein